MHSVSIPHASLPDVLSRIENGQLDDAHSLLRSLLQKAPSDGHLHALVGVCNAQQGKLDAAVKSLETAALLSPGDPAIECKLATVLIHLGRHEQARWRIDRVLENDPTHEEARQLQLHLQAARPAPTAPAPHPGGTLPQAACAPVARPGYSPQVHRATPLSETSPGLGTRLLRGTGWGLLYAQVWTVCSLVGALLISLLATRVEIAVIAFLIMAVLSGLFHSAMGALIGVTAAFLNADEDTGGWIGMSVGLLILLIGLVAGFLAFWSVFFYILLGRWMGRSVAAHIQKPVAA